MGPEGTEGYVDFRGYRTWYRVMGDPVLQFLDEVDRGEPLGPRP